MSSKFHVSTPREIVDGKVTDVYFRRTKEILSRIGLNKSVIAEFAAKRFPPGQRWAVLAGIEECVAVLRRLKVNCWTMREGTLFRENEPVMVIEGPYSAFCIYETVLLGLMCQASGIATKAARCRKLAADKALLSFGARRMHPAIAPMVERSAYLGGCDGVAAVKSAELLGVEPVGTIPHALVLVCGSLQNALEAFENVIAKRIRRVALVDTLCDEKIEALDAARVLGDRLYAVRLDTPPSRRGDMLEILKEVRWELDIRGFKHVKIFVSGGIDEEQIASLRDFADGFGIGTRLSAAPVIDFAMDIVEVESKPFSKRGKPSGRKSVFRCTECFSHVVISWRDGRPKKCPCGGSMHPLLRPLTAAGKVVAPLPHPSRIRRFVIKQLEHFEL